ncbi:transporter substrate-binding domain-containing protein [Chelativorans alearense]|uniref:transporter substrate-binding domain-containing protein n=1 Tax=Chelativorans alearense TaxID=2681495 RepID=UPI0013D7017F|nr:transporter substrate-binding domain-containing protein [Chelativorans alearense]
MLAVAFLAVVVVLGSALPGDTETRIPQIWDAKQRLPKPEVLPIQRLRFLTTTDFFPFNFLDSDGRLAGFHVDLARAICEALALEDRCQIQALPFDELEEALHDGQGEALIAGLAITREAREKFLFSRAYLQFPARFVTDKDAVLAEPIHEKVAGKRVGVLAGTAHEQMLRDLFAEARVVTYSRREWLLGDLKAGKLDAAFGDGMRLGFWLASTEAEGCCVFTGGPYLAPEYLGHGLAIAVRRDQSALAAALDYALQKIEERGTFAELYLRYFPVGFY